MVFDSSASVGDKNYWVLKQFAVDVAKGLRIAKNESRMGLVTFADDAETRFGLAKYTDMDALESALWSTPWKQGVTNTQDGLDHAMKIIDNEARADVKHIVIVITDGESNVKKENTIPKAQEMHNKGIEIFTVGIGAINEVELKGIASDDKDFHFHYVTNYAALVSITNTIINDTCETAARKKCGEWGEFGPCEAFDQEKKCGAGQMTRERTCEFYLWKGAPSKQRVHTDKQECEIPCVEDPEPPVCQDDCAKNQCSLDPTDGNCEKFSKCVRMCECMLGTEDP